MIPSFALNWKDSLIPQHEFQTVQQKWGFVDSYYCLYTILTLDERRTKDQKIRLQVHHLPFLIEVIVDS